tara:strand:+ start:96 stop:482 length:387 start_codon:yes stop_codon:yes gene_type:complete
MMLITGNIYQTEDADVIAWQRAYPKVDVHQELAAMESWLDANPAKRKTPKGIKRFINSWLSRAQNQGGSPMVKSYRKADSLRSKTIEMQMGDVSWLQGEELEMMKSYYLRVIGYYYDGDLKNAQGVIS